MGARLADLAIALRNVTRNRRRSATAIFIVVAGVVSLVLAEGFIQWIFWAMRESTIHFQSGHIQVVRPDYFAKGVADPLAYLLPKESAVPAAIEATPGVKLVAPRIKAAGLISHGDTTVAFLAEGVVPGKEADLSLALKIVEGRNLADPHAAEVILGRGLARTLGVKSGDTVALLTTPAGGGIGGIEATVAGLFVSTSQAYDNTALRLPITQAQALLRSQGAHVWIVLLEETARTDEFVTSFRERFGAQRLEFAPWHAQADFYNKTVALLSQQINVLRTIIGAIIVLSIFNILTMNVMERTGEIGTMLAVGFRRKKILQMFATEGLVLGLIGASLGVGIGYGLGELISDIGIPMPPPPGMDEGYTGEILTTGTLLLTAFLLGFTTTLLAGLYPAWKASRQEIVNALRHNI